MPNTDAQATCFDSPERLDRAAVDREHDIVTRQAHVMTLLDGYPEPAAVLDSHRQIVLANEKMCVLLGKDRDALGSLRIGEALDCEHATDEPNGCGTSESCVMCGTARGIRFTNRQRIAARNDCRMMRTTPGGLEALDLSVWTTPLDIDGQPFTIIALRDTTDEQRRRVLERLFFHDVLNTAGSLKGLMEVWRDLPPQEATELTGKAAQMATQVVEEIQAQRDLSAAERGDLVPQPVRVNAADSVATVVLAYAHNPAAGGCEIVTRPVQPRLTFVTDPVLFRRVVGNLLKNALEASSQGGVVTIWCDAGERFRLHVHNTGVMGDGVRVQIFQRSFTTKGGSGRGVGTYSARLLVEKYLRGHISFVSAPETGTVFTIELPIE